MTSIKVAIASNSLGKSSSGHTLLHKLEAAKLHEFDGVEVAIECLEAHASSFSQPSRASRLRAAAADVSRKAQDLALSLIALNPFGAYDGLVDLAEVESRLEEAELWFELCRLMRIPIFQVRTSDILISDFVTLTSHTYYRSCHVSTLLILSELRWM
jgi:4-hydroxyphenylpyruvate dioxygenase